MRKLFLLLIITFIWLSPTVAKKKKKKKKINKIDEQIYCSVCESLVEEIERGINETKIQHSVQVKFRIDEKQRIPYARTEFRIMEIIEGLPIQLEKYGTQGKKKVKPPVKIVGEEGSTDEEIIDSESEKEAIKKAEEETFESKEETFESKEETIASKAEEEAIESGSVVEAEAEVETVESKGDEATESEEQITISKENTLVNTEAGELLLFKTPDDRFYVDRSPELKKKIKRAYGNILDKFEDQLVSYFKYEDSLVSEKICIDLVQACKPRVVLHDEL